MRKKPRLTSFDIGLPSPNLKMIYSHHLTVFQRNLLARAFGRVARCLVRKPAARGRSYNPNPSLVQIAQK